MLRVGKHQGQVRVCEERSGGGFGCIAGTLKRLALLYGTKPFSPFITRRASNGMRHRKTPRRTIEAMIIDDERLARNDLRAVLEKFPQVKITGEAANVSEAAHNAP